MIDWFAGMHKIRVVVNGLLGKSKTNKRVYGHAKLKRGW